MEDVTKVTKSPAKVIMKINPSLYKYSLFLFFMGVIRGGLLVIVSVLLFVSLLAGNLFLTMSWSLDYDNVKTELVSVVKELVEEEGGKESPGWGNC